jgi:hypothetical protein
MIKKSSFLLLKGDIHFNPSTCFKNCTDMNVYSVKLYQYCRVPETGMFAEKANIDYRLSFADQGKQTSVFRFLYIYIYIETEA